MATPEKYKHINFKPPNGVRREAEYGLKLRREHGRGGTAVGIARARDLSNGAEVSPETVRRMKAFFDRHQSDESAPGFNRGDPQWPSNGLIANKLWGGPSGYSWAKKVVEQMNAADEKEGRSLRPYGSTHGMRPKVFVVHGPPASGKTSYVFGKKGESDVVFDFDRVMAAISGLPLHQKVDSLTSYCLDIRTLILKKAISGSESAGKTWIITTNVSDDLRRQLSDIPTEYVHIDTPMDECMKRVKEDPDRQHESEELQQVIKDYFEKNTESRAAAIQHGVERRYLGNFSDVERADPDLLRVERRADPQTGKPQTYIVGYAARFHRDSLLLGDFVERIDPGAFDIVMSRTDGDGNPLQTRCLFNHDPNHLLGRFPTTMRLIVDEKGLRYECLLPESRADIGESISRGDLKGSSFSFVVADGGEEWTNENGQSIRLVKKIKSLLDCGPVTYPAYGDASVAVAKRSYEHFVNAPAKSTESENARRRFESLAMRAEVLRARIAAESFLAERRDCGREDDGKFGAGNECQGSKGGSGKPKGRGKKQGKASGKPKGKKSADESESDQSEPESDPNEPTVLGNAALGAALGGAAGLTAGVPGALAGAAVGGAIGAVNGAIGKGMYKVKKAVNKKIKTAQDSVLGSGKNRQSRYDELQQFLAERRDCGRDEGGRFGSGNECQGSNGGPGKNMEWKKGKDKEAQDFIDSARKGQLERGGKTGGKSDDGSGVQTWSKGDTYPWTAKQVGDSENGGYVQGIHPDGSKTKKYEFPAGGSAEDAYRKAEDEIKQKKKKRGERSIGDVHDELRAFLRSRQ